MRKKSRSILVQNLTLMMLVESGRVGIFFSPRKKEEYHQNYTKNEGIHNGIIKTKKFSLDQKNI